MAVVVIVASVFWGHLVYWQVGEHSFLSAEAQAQGATTVQLLARRGIIYDSQGTPVALDTTVYNVALSPPQVLSRADERTASEGLASALKIQPEQVMRLYRQKVKYAYVAKRVSQQTANRIQAMGLTGDGVTLEAQPERTYLPGGEAGDTLGAQFLGFVNYAGAGVAGLESYYNQQLGGRNGWEKLYKDSSGNLIPGTTESKMNPQQGENMTLTVDAHIQYQAEQAIQAAVTAKHAQQGSVIILDTQTGGVLGWASYPSFNANDFATTASQDLTDPIAGSVYEPGSVMKVVTLAGALDSGAITPQATIDDPGYIVVDGQQLNDWNNAAWGTVSYTKVLEQSLNVGAVHAQQAEGSANFLHYLRAFGFGKPTGVGVAGEQNVALPNLSGVQEATAAYGEGLDVTMVQMAAAINTIANGGVYVQPHLVQSIGGATQTYGSHRAVKAQTADEMKAMMRSVDQYGEGRQARIPAFQYDMSGKTGTSQIPVNGKYSPTDFWSSFAGFMPSQNPQFTMLMMLKDPQNGSVAADEADEATAPEWKALAQQLVVDEHITPENLPPQPD
ncbi:MAG: penicillin-binding protein 2 [Candidatus Dormibacteraeota bacterium]|nr:penicillin-binding protein 2 [Candidatus Dormibacteraeota bacterium]MBO0743764.1 penicillin-binding protein 2 [Candidatus Dormibacteraeota bacterium]